MSNRSHDDRAASRAEARRRARQVARGELPPEDPGAETEEVAPAREGGFLRRIFPTAPPLPNRPDPLAGFDPSGPMRPVRERLFLLRRTIPVWVLAALGAFIGYVAYRFYAQGILGVFGMFIMFGALIAAGWFGWQRPTLVGTTAGILSFVLVAVFVTVDFATQGAGPDTFGTTDVAAVLLLEGLYQAGLGFIGGWYGGYLRRRQASLSTDPRRARR